ncbi:alpha-2-macroglobulin family protein [Hymenobacter cheonanensis]|uniref:alpha-2-macroglobulin family protein n=1 Tax=Hymenobacter sp. CA2-7 TaxID=3063993 RepID=UPI00271306F5|nr:MG2 domain-containing protein [Hymenobacter sp. CA2-7]MDO7885307.1 MG2 domain-containing protein [Hymenobacter sp. CA2-7]
MTVFLADSAAPGPPSPLAAQWKKIDALLAREQTASAAPLVEKIYQQAKKENNAPAYVRALLYKIRLLENKENDADEKAIALLEKDLKTAQFPARPILHSLLGGLYSAYYNEHRYQLYERTSGAAPTTDPATPGRADGGTSLATWDAGRLGAAIVRHYEQSVADEPQRQLKTTLADLGDLATGGDTEGRALRPTLYDLLAQRAIAGLQNQELFVTKPEQQWQPTEPRLFGSAQEFAALKLSAPVADSLNGQLLALRLLQRLTAARLAANNPAALADVDLQRLDYVHGLTEGTDVASQYEPALARLAEQYKALPISTEFIAKQAEARRTAGDNVAAVALTRAAEARFPKSRGAARARQLRAEMEQPELAFSAAEMVVPGQPWRLDLTTRNVPELHAWAYRITAKEWQQGTGYDPQNRPLAKRFARALKAAPAATWAVPLPAHPLDYKEQKLAAAGAALPAGYYLILLSNKAQLSTDPAVKSAPAGTVTAYAVLGASQLSLVHRTNAATGTTSLLLLDRASGAPLAGVKNQANFSVYNRTTQRDDRRLGEVLPTSATGEVEIPGPNKASDALGREQLSGVRSWLGRDTLLTPLNAYYFPGRQNEAEQAQRRTFLFTDRAIYRPGQTVYFKGILTQSLGGKASLLTGQPVSVRLVDVNGQTVQTLTFTTSDFSSFNGSLVLPTGLLNGEMQLQTDHGSLSFAVEDYKRPTFLVTLDSVPGRPQLGQPLTLNGRARAYAGQATDGASVKYRITRRELWPLFDYGFGGGRGIMRPGPRGGTQEIAHGTTTTDAEGRFAITFTPPLVPKQSSRGRWEPGYLFEVTADVTDAAGETRTGTRYVVLGRNPLSLRLAGPDQADKARLPAFTLLGTNATGEPLPATGTLRLLARRYRSNPPGVPGPAPETTDNELPAELVKTLPFDTHASPVLDLRAALASLPTGRYRLEAQAAGADSARASLDFTLFDSNAATVPFATPDWFVALADTVAPGQSAAVLLGSSEADARILLEVERGGQLLRREWLTLKAGEQRRLAVASGSADARGPLYIHTTQVRDGRLYRHDATVQVTEQPQPLRLAIATFRDRLAPGQRETWRLTIRQANGRPADAELLATLYDQSLDVFRPHSFQGLEFGGNYFPARFGWQGNFGEFNSESYATTNDGLGPKEVRYPQLNDWQRHLDEVPDQEELKDKVVSTITVKGNSDMYEPSGKIGAPSAGPSRRARAASPMMALQGKVAGVAISGNGYVHAEDSNAQPKTAPDLTTIAARSDFRETAFWQPALRTDQNGDVVLEFQMPEAVTRWQLLALAHDRSLHTGQLARQLVTQKEIQITPNAPRFLRPGDAFTFPAKFSNLTDHATSGTAQLFLLDAATGQDITSQLLKGPAQLPVSAAAHQSAALGWELAIPADFAPVAVTYRVVAQTSGEAEPTAEASANAKGKKKNRQAPLPRRGGAGGGATYSDGEENTLPVLPNRILITESLPLPLAGPGTREFELKKLTSTASPTRRNYSLTLEMTANPAWYAVQSLPYLLEYPYECSEQTFARLYANLLAAQILKSNPRFRTVLAEWQRQAQSGTAAQQNALASKLAQNQELKNILLQETPWVRDAQGETERLARLSSLFDEVRLKAETTRTLAKLQAMQLPDGSFPWFEKMPADRYITQLIVAGFGKLQKLGAFDASQDNAARNILQHALHYLDGALARDYAELRRQKAVKLADNHLDDLEIQALYARSFWLAQPVAAEAQPAYAYYRTQAASHWAGRTRYLQAQLALALFRENAKAPAAQAVMQALAENALHSPELGMYWKDVQPGYYWREAPVETQATLIEAFDEIKNAQKAVDELKLWLLAHKQTHSWESTRATADACYALLLRGTSWLAPAQPLQVSMGGQAIRPEATQAGTGYYRQTWPAADIQPAQGKVTVTKTDAGPAWGALYWQYFEDLDKVTPAASPLSVERQLYRETRTAAGPQLERITTATPLRVGDALVVRLVLRTNRALEYVHLKDQRAAGLEPINQLSGYRYQAGLGYYESPRDAAANFFLSEVPRGTHVFEYRLRASQAGNFSGGLSQVQCLYAPEFGATSAGQRLAIAPQVAGR